MTAAPAATAAQNAAVAEARQVVVRSGTSFHFGMRVLPKARREAMYAIYAFCRAVDDIADEPGARADKLAMLGAWRGEIENLYHGRPTWPIACFLAGPVADYDLPKAEFLALIEGMEMDAREAIQAPSWDDYRLYCRRVAGAVGMLSVRVFGETSATAEELAVILGEALQTTNILRDLAEDAERGRVYLPCELLDAHGLSARDPAALLAAPGLAPACAELAEHARTLYGLARERIAACDRRRIRPALLMLEIYQRLLERLEARGWDQPRTPVKVPRIEKLWIALRHGLF
jgi:phytoene synthase